MHNPADQLGLDFMYHLLKGAARLLAEGGSFAELHRWLTMRFENGVPGMDMLGELPAPAIQALATQLALGIWNATPLPQRGLRPHPRISAERNQPCPCGSGRKYKQCCAAMALPPFPVEEALLLAAVLEDCPLAQLRAMPLHSLRPQLLEEVAGMWNEEDRPLRAADLLTAALEQHPELDSRHAGMASLLLHLQLTLNRPKEKAALKARLLASPDRVVQANGWQQEAVEASDRGDWQQAWQAFTNAQRLDPKDLALSHLEILLLLSQGRQPEAEARVEFWRRQLLRDGSEHALGLIPLLEAMVHEGLGGDALMAVASPVMQELKQLLEQSRPECQYQLGHGPDQQRDLQPNRRLYRAERQALDGEYWLDDASLQEWLDLFKECPLALQSFDVLLVLEDHLHALGNSQPGLAGVRRALLGCGERLRLCVLQALHAEDAVFPSLLEGNRAMLQLAAAGMARLAVSEMPLALEIGRWLLRADPRDGVGAREVLLHCLIRAGEMAEAIALGERYPGDFAFTSYGFALALFADGQHERALAALLDATRHFPKVWQALISDDPREPQWSPYTQVGSAEEGWIYRAHYLDDWQGSGALDWAMQRLTKAGTLRKRKPRS